MAKAKIGFIGFIRNELKEDFWGTLEKVARIGYQGIEGELPQLLEGDVDSNMKRFHDLGLRILTISASREQLRDNFDEVLQKAKKYNSPRVSVWWGPCDSREQLLKDAELYNTAGEKLAAEGLKLCYHNHGHEFKTTFNGLYAWDILIEHTDPRYVYFEPDIAWITFGGEDPVKVLRRMQGRIPAIHVKDLYEIGETAQFTAVGTGLVKVKEAVQAAIDTGVEWIVIEQDRLRNLTAFETLTLSCLYLREAGLV